MQAGFYHMNSLALTLTRNHKTSIQCRGLIQPPLLCRGGNSTSAGGFPFVIFAPMGAIQSKEVAIATVGLHLYHPNIALQSFIQKEITL
jgi:hypothetical protein